MDPENSKILFEMIDDSIKQKLEQELDNGPNYAINLINTKYLNKDNKFKDILNKIYPDNNTEEKNDLLKDLLYINIIKTLEPEIRTRMIQKDYVKIKYDTDNNTLKRLTANEKINGNVINTITADHINIYTFFYTILLDKLAERTELLKKKYYDYVDNLIKEYSKSVNNSNAIKGLWDTLNVFLDDTIEKDKFERLGYDHQYYIIAYIYFKGEEHNLLTLSQREIGQYKTIMVEFIKIFNKLFQEDAALNDNNFSNKAIILDIIKEDKKTNTLIKNAIISFLLNNIKLDLDKFEDSCFKNKYEKYILMNECFLKLIKEILEKKQDIINKTKKNIEQNIRKLKNIEDGISLDNIKTVDKYKYIYIKEGTKKEYDLKDFYTLNKDKNIDAISIDDEETLKINETEYPVKSHVFYIMFNDFLINTTKTLEEKIKEKEENDRKLLEEKEREKEENDRKLLEEKEREALNSEEQINKYKDDINKYFENIKIKISSLNDFYKSNTNLVIKESEKDKLEKLIKTIININGYKVDGTSIFDIHKKIIIDNNYTYQVDNENEFFKNTFESNLLKMEQNVKYYRQKYEYYKFYYEFLDELIDNIFGAVRIVINKNPNPPNKGSTELEFDYKFPNFNLKFINNNDKFTIDNIKEYFENNPEKTDTQFINAETSTFKYILDKLISKNNIVISTYGQSGSGKTFSLFGKKAKNKNEKDKDGFVILLLNALKNKKFKYKIKEIYELYNKFTVNDKEIKKDNVDDFIELTSGHTYNNEIKKIGHDLTKYMKSTPTDDVDIIKQINTDIEDDRIKNERIRSTPFNPQSSRSFLFLDIDIYNSNDEYCSNLFIVDMAGIENQKIMLATILSKLYVAKTSYIISPDEIKNWVSDAIELPIDNKKIWEKTKVWRGEAHNYKVDMKEVKKIMPLPTSIKADDYIKIADYIRFQSLKLMNEGKFINCMIEVFKEIFKFKMNEKIYKDDGNLYAKELQKLNTNIDNINNLLKYHKDILKKNIMDKIILTDKDSTNKILKLLNVRDDISDMGHIKGWFPLHTLTNKKFEIKYGQKEQNNQLKKEGGCENNVENLLINIITIIILILFIIIIILLIIFIISEYGNHSINLCSLQHY
jgi:hypothetical protein